LQQSALATPFSSPPFLLSPKSSAASAVCTLRSPMYVASAANISLDLFLFFPPSPPSPRLCQEVFNSNASPLKLRVSFEEPSFWIYFFASTHFSSAYPLDRPSPTIVLFPSLSCSSLPPDCSPTLNLLGQGHRDLSFFLYFFFFGESPFCLHETLTLRFNLYSPLPPGSGTRLYWQSSLHFRHSSSRFGRLILFLPDLNFLFLSSRLAALVEVLFFFFGNSLLLDRHGG